MLVITSTTLALILCIYCCICWGSWGNIQKLVGTQGWSFELFYFDFILGCFVTALVGCVIFGTAPDTHNFYTDLGAWDWYSIGYAFLGGVIWTFASIFLSAAMAVAGMSVGFPIGGGLGWIGGIVFTYILSGGNYRGNEALLWIGVAIVIVAIVLCSKAYSRLSREKKSTPRKGIVLALISGIALIFFYGLVVQAIAPKFVAEGSGSLMPLSAVFWFAVGALVGTPFFNIPLMRNPVQGNKVSLRDYFVNGSISTHLIGMLGGFIWMSGMVASFLGVGSGLVNPSVSYALSNAAPVVAMIWGVFVWHEFRGAPKGTNVYVGLVFAFFLAGLVILTLSNN